MVKLTDKNIKWIILHTEIQKNKNSGRDADMKESIRDASFMETGIELPNLILM